MRPAPDEGSMVLLTRLARVVYRRATESVLGMRLKEYTSLCYLRDHEPLTQQALAEAMHLDANNCVLLLNELEAAGLAERRRDPTDRRRHLVAINPAGRQALERAERALESVEDEVLGSLSASERATLRSLLSRALEGEARMAAAERPGPADARSS
ncbi:MAG TPA: MarR family transcriptional regulator [Candidatus Dormibacteraeota bacterium]|nr:MarR family transcriptional regulator [Candidatus Dormibacteraeota bacterium]